MAPLPCNNLIDNEGFAPVSPRACVQRTNESVPQRPDQCLPVCMIHAALCVRYAQWNLTSGAWLTLYAPPRNVLGLDPARDSVERLRLQLPVFEAERTMSLKL